MIVKGNCVWNTGRAVLILLPNGNKVWIPLAKLMVVKGDIAPEVVNQFAYDPDPDSGQSDKADGWRYRYGPDGVCLNEPVGEAVGQVDKPWSPCGGGPQDHTDHPVVLSVSPAWARKAGLKP
jgi:hypothetical protein